MAGKRILTNKFNLPDTLVKAVQYDTHKMVGATISTTTLIDGAQIRHLKSIHDYESDVIDNIFALMGTAMHHILERANIDNVRERAFMLVADTIMEKAQEIDAQAPDKAERLNAGAKWIRQLIPIFFPELSKKYIFEKTMLLKLGEDHVLSGTFDLYDRETGILYDYKFCGTFMWSNPEARKKWEEQLNIYAYMLQLEGLPVMGIRVVAFFRDWSAGKTLGSKDYPNTQIKEIVIPMRSMDETWALITHHINLHRRAESGDIPLCSGETRWASADEYAVMLKGGKRALKKFETTKAANGWIEENNHKYSLPLWIQPRPGTSRRCESYCVVSKVCPQYKAELERKATMTE